MHELEDSDLGLFFTNSTTLFLLIGVELLPVLWLEAIHVQRVWFASLDPTLDTSSQGQGMDGGITLLGNVVGEPARAARTPTVGAPWWK